ncbi:MAG: DNA integrity scanning diadenylate cyclase DisA [Clostridia bacterium]|nr:DNA integrity scanning diadenylate cyclase DisA [Clostridia bacterium]
MLNKEVLELIKMTAPGTLLREGLDNIIRAGTGALVVVTDPTKLTCLIDGGFRIDSEFLPAYLYELSKMDGAIVVSRDLKRILLANTLLIPNPLIQTFETGTRHKAAERTAKQTGELVICISHRRNVISLYKGDIKYILRSTSEILAHANNALQTMEKNKKVLTRELENLTTLEFNDMSRLLDVVNVIIRAEIATRIADEIRTYICELGVEGRLVSIQLEELLTNIEDEELLVIEDYMVDGCPRHAIEILEELHMLNDDDLADFEVILRKLGYDPNAQTYETTVAPRGYRALSKISRIPKSVQSKLVKKFSNINGIMAASIEVLDNVDGIGEQRAKSINLGLKRIKERLIID